MSLLVNNIDSWVDASKPTLSYGAGRKLQVELNQRLIYLRFAKPFPKGATIDQGKLRLRLRDAFTGTITFTVKRVTTSWKEGKVNWNNKPTVVGTNSASVTVVAGQAGDEIEWNILLLLQDVANGDPYYGFQIESNSATRAIFVSSEGIVEDRQPKLLVTWDEKPGTPTDLGPNNQIVSSATPKLDWSGARESASVQVQVSTVADFSSILWDSTKIASTIRSYALLGSSYPPGAVNSVRYWRVKYWNTANIASDWSDIAMFTYKTRPALTLVTPTAVVNETTPPVGWTFANQSSYRIIVEKKKISAGTHWEYGGQVADVVEWKTLWDSGRVASVENGISIPSQIITSTTATYRVTLRTWDTEDRYSGSDIKSYVEVQREFTFARSNVIVAVPVITAITGGTPKIRLEWDYSGTLPDKWAINMDGDQVDEIDLMDAYISTGKYAYDHWGAKPRVNHTYEVAAVRLDAGVEKHSSGNATVVALNRPRGRWLACRNRNLWVGIMGVDDDDIGIGTTGEIHSPKRSKKLVRITDSVRGYEGSITGIIIDFAGKTAKEMKDDYLAIIALNNTERITLTMADLNIPIGIEPGIIKPSPEAGPKKYTVSFNFWQVGDWPMEVKGLD